MKLRYKWIISLIFSAVFMLSGSVLFSPIVTLDDEIQTVVAEDSSSLPDGYFKLEYIESDGTQFIDTGASAVYRFEGKIRYESNPNTLRYVYGSKNEQLINALEFNGWAYLHARQQNSTLKNQLTVRYDSYKSQVVPFDVDYINKTFRYLNYSSNFSYDISLPEMPNMYLFAINNNGTAECFASFKLYMFKMYDQNNALIRDFVPCRRAYDGKIGLYDFISQEFFYSSTPFKSSTLTGDKLPQEYVKTDYLINNGGYIDTEISGDYSHKINITTYAQSWSNYKIWGIENTTDDFVYELSYSNNASTQLLRKADKEYTSGINNLQQCLITTVIDENDFKQQGTKNGKITIDEIDSKTTTLNYFLFASNNNGTPLTTTNKSLRIYEYSLYSEDDTCLQYLIPCVRKVDNVPGFYDLINNKFYKNSNASVDDKDAFFFKNHITVEENVEIKSWKEEFENYASNNNITLSGAGTSASPYLVSSVYELICASQFNSVNPNATIKLLNDVSLNDGYFKDDKYFDGGDGVLYNWDVLINGYNFYGNSHKISGLYSNTSALFKYLHGNGTIQDLTVEGAYINMIEENSAIVCGSTGYPATQKNIKVSGKVKSTGNNVGGICGNINKYSNSISNCINYANIEGGNYTGGIIGNSSGENSITNCVNHGDVKGNLYVGGVAGFTNGKKKTKLINRGNVSGNDKVGGIAGSGSGNEIFVDCENYGDITAKYATAGMVCYTYNGAISYKNCANYGDVYSSNGNCAGFFAQSGHPGFMPELNNCKNYGNISAPNGTAYGISHRIKSAIDCQNNGDIIGKNAVGICGEYLDRIIECVNYGKVKAINGRAAGITDCRGSYNGNVNNQRLTTIANCVNHGDVTGTDLTSGIVLRLYHNTLVKNCINKGNITGSTAAGLCAFAQISNKFTDEITGCVNEGNITAQNYASGLIGEVNGGVNLIENCINSGIIQSKGYSGSLMGINRGNITITNCLNSGNVSATKQGKIPYVGASSGKIAVKSYISTGKLNQAEYKYAEGKNFRAYYYSWRTGKIGLTVRDGGGLFQGRVDEEYLFNNGFEGDYHSQLVSEYYELEYIESDGNQYIDTEVYANDNIVIDCDFSVKNLNANRNYIIGVSGDNGNRIQFSYSSSMFCGWGASYDDSQTLEIDTNKHNLKMNSNGFTIDNNKIYDVKNNTFTGKYSIYLFAMNEQDRLSRPSSGVKIYAFKIYENNVLIRDFVPAVHNGETTEVGFYDKVTGQFFTNKGTGTFKRGPLVNA